MKKIVFAALMLIGVAGVTQAQTPAQKKSAAKPASSVTTVTPAKKPIDNTKATSTTTKVNPANIGKHKKAHHKAAKKPAKKS